MGCSSRPAGALGLGHIPGAGGVWDALGGWMLTHRSSSVLQPQSFVPRKGLEDHHLLRPWGPRADDGGKGNILSDFHLPSLLLFPQPREPSAPLES